MELLFALLVLLVVTRLCGEVAVRLGQPALVGELVGGILLGLLVHSSPEHFPALSGLSEDPEFRAITDLGVFFLMLLAGLEMKPSELTQGSARSLSIGVGGLIIPLVLGSGLGWLFIPESPHRPAQALFLGTAVAITAVPVAIKILMDLGQLDSKLGQAIVAAALVDDVLSLILLSVLTALIRTGELMELQAVALLVGQIVSFFALTAGIGLWALPKLRPRLARLVGSDVELSLLIGVALLFAVLAEMLHMHFIIGAFVAGLFFSARTLPGKTFERVQSQVSGLTKGFLAPLFFASIGLHLDLSSLASVPVFAGLLVLVALAGKVIGAGGAARLNGMPARAAMTVGVAMSARGAVELIVADVALQAGLFDKPDPPDPVVEHMFSAVVIMAIVTTLITPLGLRALLARRSSTSS